MNRSLLALALLPALLAGCAQLLGGNAELPQRRYYLIEAEPVRNNLPQSERPYAAKVQVKTFAVQRAYNRNDIMYRRDQYELQRDQFHSWVTRPGDLFTDAVMQYLRQANLFTYVGGDGDFLDARPDYVLNGTIKAIERFDSGDIWAAHLAIDMQLVRQEDARVIWQHDFDEERTVFFPEMKHTVAAFSEILRQQMEKSLREMDFLFLMMERGDEGSLEDMVPLEAPRAALVDTSRRVETDERDYELLPGKLAP